jgi:hypothetical protein
MGAVSDEPFPRDRLAQADAIARCQGAGAGVAPHTMRNRVRDGRWRREIALALGDAAGGALSVLEYRYVHRVERPHGLPAARRQARVRQDTGNRYLDNFYEEYGVCVEVDGTAAHPADEQWRDKRRDNANAVRGIVTLRFGLLDLGDRRCETASAVAALLRRHGWTGSLRACGRGCVAAPS